MKIRSMLEKDKDSGECRIRVALEGVIEKPTKRTGRLTVKIQNDNYSQIYTDAIHIPEAALIRKGTTTIASRFKWPRERAENQLKLTHKAIAEWAKQ